MTTFEKEIRHQLLKKKNQQLTQQNARQLCRHLNCPITLSNYKHEKYTVLLELKEANLHY